VDESYRLTVSAVDLAQDKRTLLGTVELPKPDKPQSRLTNDDFAELFEEFFGEKTRKSRGRDIEMPLTITAQQAQNGDVLRVQFRRAAVCSRCGGSGAADHASWSTCARCGGKGSVQEKKQTLLGSRPGMTTCPICRGKGRVPSAVCSACNGTGNADAETTLEVKVPAGIKAGQRLRLKGQGEMATNGGTPGDLYLVIEVKD
jgi:molecular chaperone DnaJ